MSRKACNSCIELEPGQPARPRGKTAPPGSQTQSIKPFGKIPFRDPAGLRKAERAPALLFHFDQCHGAAQSFATAQRLSRRYRCGLRGLWTRKCRLRDLWKLTAADAIQSLCPGKFSRSSSHGDVTHLRARLNSSLQQVIIAWAEPSIPSDRTCAVGEVTSLQPAFVPFKGSGLSC